MPRNDQRRDEFLVEINPITGDIQDSNVIKVQDGKRIDTGRKISEVLDKESIEELNRGETGVVRKSKIRSLKGLGKAISKADRQRILLSSQAFGKARNQAANIRLREERAKQKKFDTLRRQVNEQVLRETRSRERIARAQRSLRNIIEKAPGGKTRVGRGASSFISELALSPIALGSEAAAIVDKSRLSIRGLSNKQTRKLTKQELVRAHKEHIKLLKSDEFAKAALKNAAIGAAVVAVTSPTGVVKGVKDVKKINPGNLSKEVSKVLKKDLKKGKGKLSPKQERILKVTAELIVERIRAGKVPTKISRAARRAQLTKDRAKLTVEQLKAVGRVKKAKAIKSVKGVSRKAKTKIKTAAKSLKKSVPTKAIKSFKIKTRKIAGKAKRLKRRTARTISRTRLLGEQLKAVGKVKVSKTKNIAKRKIRKSAVGRRVRKTTQAIKSVKPRVKRFKKKTVRRFKKRGTAALPVPRRVKKVLGIRKRLQRKGRRLKAQIVTRRNLARADRKADLTRFQSRRRKRVKRVKDKLGTPKTVQKPKAEKKIFQEQTSSEGTVSITKAKTKSVRSKGGRSKSVGERVEKGFTVTRRSIKGVRGLSSSSTAKKTSKGRTKQLLKSKTKNRIKSKKTTKPKTRAQIKSLKGLSKTSVARARSRSRSTTNKSSAKRRIPTAISAASLIRGGRGRGRRRSRIKKRGPKKKRTTDLFSEVTGFKGSRRAAELSGFTARGSGRRRRR